MNCPNEADLGLIWQERDFRPRHRFRFSSKRLKYSKSIIKDFAFLLASQRKRRDATHLYERFHRKRKKRLIPTEQFSRFLKKCTVEMNKNTFSEKLYSRNRQNTFSEKLYSKNERRNRDVWFRDESFETRL